MFQFKTPVSVPAVASAVVMDIVLTADAVRVDLAFASATGRAAGSAVVSVRNGESQGLRPTSEVALDGFSKPTPGGYDAMLAAVCGGKDFGEACKRAMATLCALGLLPEATP